ncbi:3-phenylpropionate/trans-cinnamate dioxygenase ferredoxin reductase subunit [Nocardioides terrae]|uniref:3-phenylpropionate/trans-cinnamate dioxygenase ferredoxin reductase subunit n=1 Tax=Nocardioides terrae TaxID=574651 RepID=A0A1I1M2X3_9ACTN|nr:FAD/NAD(P)-binding oxidoreductase [Nocardioides terrae]SFC76943.1 3-phenylpropionate/trans-cinnamate dioxygenase ferredoxin reductase subunit [Nocardioides terrae]
MSTAPIVVVGGGLAAGTAITELRERGYTGPLVALTDEPRLPYERPPLSKGYLMGKDAPDGSLVHDRAWYDEHDVDVRTGTRVEAIDPANRTVLTRDGELGYRSLLLATGARPRRLALADDSGAPVTYLRTFEDSTALREQLRPDRRIGIIGGGWIGLEVAAAAREAGASVTVLEALEQPLLNVLGGTVAEIFADLHRRHGVDLRTGVRVERITSAGAGAVVELADGGRFEVDHLVVGVGAVPATELAEAAGLTVDNGVRTDSALRASAPDVFAAGDVANADHPVLGHPLRVEHWDTAIKHGKVAGANLAGGAEVADALPYFFTDQYDLGMEYVGNAGPDGFDRVVVEGDVPGLNFRAWWLRSEADGERVVAGMHVNDWDAIDEIRSRVGGLTS